MEVGKGLWLWIVTGLQWDALLLCCCLSIVLLTVNVLFCTDVSQFKQQLQSTMCIWFLFRQCGLSVLLESPRTLTHLCRLRIRHCFTSQQLLTDDVILSLPLPTTILDYLLYKQSVWYATSSCPHCSLGLICVLRDCRIMYVMLYFD